MPAPQEKGIPFIPSSWSHPANRIASFAWLLRQIVRTIMQLWDVIASRIPRRVFGNDAIRIIALMFSTCPSDSQNCPIRTTL